MSYHIPVLNCIGGKDVQNVFIYSIISAGEVYDKNALILLTHHTRISATEIV